MAGDDEGVEDAADEAWAAGLEVLLDLATTVIEAAHEIGVAAVPNKRDAQLARVDALRQAGADLVVLAGVCEVLIRRNHGG